MSYFICPHCGTRTDIFAHGGGEHAAVNLGIPSWTEFRSWSDRRTMQSGHADLVAPAVYTQTHGVKQVLIRITCIGKERSVGRDVWT